jgi:hypothetical protein
MSQQMLLHGKLRPCGGVIDRPQDFVYMGIDLSLKIPLPFWSKLA